MHFISEDLEQYCLTHSSAEPEHLQALSRETWQKIVMPRMLSGHLQGRYLSLLSHLMRPRRILEIGTFTGYSALCLAEGLRSDGELITIDINDELKWMHEKYFAMTDIGSRIRTVYGPALKMLPELEGKFDLIFIDADKANYSNYFDVCIELLSDNGVLLLDNVLWSGKVLDQAAPSDVETKTLQDLNRRIAEDVRLEAVLLPLRDGMTMVRKK